MLRQCGKGLHSRLECTKARARHNCDTQPVLHVRGRGGNASRACRKKGRAEATWWSFSWPDFATNICNMASPLFTRPFRMVQNLPFVKRAKRQRLAVSTRKLCLTLHWETIERDGSVFAGG